MAISRRGLFDPEMHPSGLFDEEMSKEGIFDEQFIQKTTTPPGGFQVAWALGSNIILNVQRRTAQ